MSETIYDAFSEFSKKFARFKKSGESLPKRKSEDDFLQDKINAGEAARKQAVSKSYRIYRDPFGELGKTSERARAIYDDEQALLRAYNLFKAVTEASGGKSDKETFVSSFTIESPLARKNAYTFGQAPPRHGLPRGAVRRLRPGDVPGALPLLRRPDPRPPAGLLRRRRRADRRRRHRQHRTEKLVMER